MDLNLFDAKLFQFSSYLMKLAKIMTDKAELTIEGEPEVGKSVVVEDENGNPVAPEDGEYATETQILVIADGKIAEIRDKEEAEQPAEEPAEEPVEEEDQPEQPEEQPEEAPADEKDTKIAELEAQIAELNNIIAEKDEEIGKLKAELEKTDAEPAEEQLKQQKVKDNSKYASRFL